MFHRSELVRAYILDQARQLLSELGVDGDDNPRTDRAALGILHRAVKSPDTPEEIRRVLRAEARLIAGRRGAGDAFDALAHDEKARADLRGLAFDRLGDICSWEGRHQEAVHLYEQSLELRPDDKRTRADLARARWHLGLPMEADQVFGMPTSQLVRQQGAAFPPLHPVAGVLEIQGLYVSSQGAGLLPIQGCVEEGFDTLVATGSLGTVAREACDLAWSLWRRRAPASPGLRIHTPSASVFKDGPSLGLAVYALLGHVLGILAPAPGDTFTGELDLKGNVLPVGSAREKATAAYLTGMRRVFLPAENAAELPEVFSQLLDLRPITTVDELEELLGQ